MHEDILKKLEQKLDRRSFLRGSGLAAAAIAGAVAMSSPIAAFAQQPDPQQPPKPDEKKKDDDKKDDKKNDKKDDQKDGDSSSGDSETKIDAQGREYRVCPQCGFNMYRQGRTWTCENCGYSYVE